MKLLVVFPDPVAETIAVLRARLTAEFPAVEFGTRDPMPPVQSRFGSPSYQSEDTPPLPYVRVRLDGGHTRYPVLHTATIRLNAYARTEDQSLELARVAQGILLAFEGNARVRSFSPVFGPISTADPDRGAPLAFLTLTARMRPQPLE